MRKLKVFEHLSLDGIAEPESSNPEYAHGEWSVPYRTSAGAQMLAAAYGTAYDLLLGRRTYDLWSGMWPKTTGSPFAAGINAATKFVATHRPESLLWGPFKAIGPDLVADVRRIKEAEGPDLILAGSVTLTQPLLEHGFVDQLVLLVYPVLLGKGKRLSPTPRPPSSSSLRARR